MALQCRFVRLMLDLKSFTTFAFFLPFLFIISSLIFRPVFVHGCASFPLLASFFSLSLPFYSRLFLSCFVCVSNFFFGPMLLFFVFVVGWLKQPHNSKKRFIRIQCILSLSHSQAKMIKEALNFYKHTYSRRGETKIEREIHRGRGKKSDKKRTQIANTPSLAFVRPFLFYIDSRHSQRRNETCLVCSSEHVTYMWDCL